MGITYLYTVLCVCVCVCVCGKAVTTHTHTPIHRHTHTHTRDITQTLSDLQHLCSSIIAIIIIIIPYIKLHTKLYRKVQTRAPHTRG